MVINTYILLIIGCIFLLSVSFFILVKIFLCVGLFFETDVLIIELLISNLWSSTLRSKLRKTKLEIDQDLLSNPSL